MKTIYILLALALFTTGCRIAFYGAVGEQRLNELTLQLGTQSADPNMADAGELLGTAVGAGLRGGK